MNSQRLSSSVYWQPELAVYGGWRGAALAGAWNDENVVERGDTQ